MIIIPTAASNGSGQHFARKYFVQLSDGYGELPISDFRDTYLTIMIDNPGVRIIGIRSVVDTSLHFSGPDTQDKWNIPLPYNPGHVTVTDFGFFLSMRQVSDSQYTSSAEMMKVSPEEVRDLLKSLQDNKGNNIWFQE